MFEIIKISQYKMKKILKKTMKIQHRIKTIYYGLLKWNIVYIWKNKILFYLLKPIKKFRIQFQTETTIHPIFLYIKNNIYILAF